MKAERFIREYAAYQIRELEEWGKESHMDFSVQIEQIRKVVMYREAGLATPNECIRMINKIW